MIRPLSENSSHLEYLCAQLEIGSPGRALARVHGGLQHSMWRLATERGTFAIKQLSATTDLSDPRVRRHYNASEAVAEAFASRGIPAVFALRRETDYLQIVDGVGYLVHPWCDAAAVTTDQIPENSALQVARILAQMHGMDLDFPDFRRHEFDAHSEENIRFLVDLARSRDLQFAASLRRGLPAFLEIVDVQSSAIRVLEHRLVISHGDLDPKNVLWDVRGRPALIDWESARKLNPTYEILLEALNWSGIGSRFDRNLFGRMISAYREAGGVIEQDMLCAAYHCVLGDWVYWLMYNVGRSFDLEDPDQRTTGARQIEYALSTLQRIMDHVPDLLSVANPRAEGTTGEEIIDV